MSRRNIYRIFITNDLGNRVAQIKNGISTTFALDTVAGLPEVIYTSANNRYLHIPGVTVAQDSNGQTRYLISDGLGSIRHAIDSAGVAVVYNDFDPYGSPITNGGAPYGYTGEWWEDEVGLLHLRARWYRPETGTFITQDPSRLERNLYQYAKANPVNFVDRTGLISSSPFEAMIQRHYQDNFALGIVRPEFSFKTGAKTDLPLNQTGDIPFLDGIPNLGVGRVDIVDVLARGVGLAYEIKHQRDAIQAAAEINWYVTVYNDPFTPKNSLDPTALVHGFNYPLSWQVVGINPLSEGSQFVLAKRSAPGVIVWKGMRMDDPRIPLPLPTHIYEWEKGKGVSKRRLQPAPVPIAAIHPCSIDTETVVEVGGTTMLIGITGYLLWNLKGCVFGPLGCIADLATPVP